MGIDALVLVLDGVVAVCAGHLFFGINGVVVGNHTAFDLMVGGLVTVCALEIETAHVHV